MKNFTKAVLRLKIWKDKHGQDLIEYALMAGFVAVAAGAGQQHQHCLLEDHFRNGSCGGQLRGGIEWWGRADGPASAAPGEKI